ncbi:hypothetical protein [Streptomyces sp. NPDC047097]|uniref:hypothetical protein n=1 Tax=Streptomyces sp. NPDC047097 TaxID=3155260 RepID=UPI0033F99CF5
MSIFAITGRGRHRAVDAVDDLRARLAAADDLIADQARELAEARRRDTELTLDILTALERVNRLSAQLDLARGEVAALRRQAAAAGRVDPTATTQPIPKVATGLAARFAVGPVVSLRHAPHANIPGGGH